VCELKINYLEIQSIGT